MSRFAHGGAAVVMALALASAAGCGKRPDRLEPPETFSWVAQPITFSPLAGNWQREGDNGGGMLGVRWVLRGGGGQCISILAFHQFAERNRSQAIARLIARRDSLTRREFLDSLSLARARTDDPLSDREAEVAAQVNSAIDRALTDYLSGSPGFVDSDLQSALRAASSYKPTLAELLPRIRLRPERMQEPDRWRIGYEHDTTLAGRPAFASEDTLITDERPLLYREVFWVVNGCGFKAVFQGAPENLPAFYRLIESIHFPEAPNVATH